MELRQPGRAPRTLNRRVCTGGLFPPLFLLLCEPREELFDAHEAGRAAAAAAAAASAFLPAAAFFFFGAFFCGLGAVPPCPTIAGAAARRRRGRALQWLLRLVQLMHPPPVHVQEC